MIYNYCVAIQKLLNTQNVKVQGSDLPTKYKIKSYQQKIKENNITSQSKTFVAYFIDPCKGKEGRRVVLEGTSLPSVVLI